MACHTKVVCPDPTLGGSIFCAYMKKAHEAQQCGGNSLITNLPVVITACRHPAAELGFIVYLSDRDQNDRNVTPNTPSKTRLIPIRSEKLLFSRSRLRHSSGKITTK